VKLLHAVCFLAATVAIVWLYDYARVAALGPVSEHAWRQADGASLALSYYQEGMRFFEPQVHNAVGGDHHAVGEFPLLYFAVASLYRLFGPDDAIFRAANLAVLLTGLFLFSRALLRWVDDLWLALVPPLFLLGSPLLAFYGFNFLPNTTAFGLVLIAASFHLSYVATGRLAWFYAAAATALLAGLLKISFLVPFLALVGAGLVTQLRPRREEDASGAPRWPHLAAATIAVLGASFAWYVWAREYNARHDSRLFLLGTRPIWSFSLEEIASEVAYLFRARRLRGFDSGGTVLLVVATYVLLFRGGSLTAVAKWTLRLTLLGSLAFLLLFFGQLHNHDYYLVDVLPCAALVLGLGVWWLKREHPSVAKNAVVRLALLLFVGANLLRSERVLSRLYRLDSHHIPPPVVSLNKREQLHQFLDDFGLDPTERVLVLGDGTPNLSLYYLNRRGWTRERRNMGPRALAKFEAKGARYLVVLAPPRRTKTGASPFPTATPIALFDGRIQFYDLGPPTEPRRPRERIVVH
jgi:hypothetical protein